MVRVLPPWFENLSKRQVKAPKIYIRDSGLLHGLLSVQSANDLYAHPKLGASWEGFAIEQIVAEFGLGHRFGQQIVAWACCVGPICRSGSRAESSRNMLPPQSSIGNPLPTAVSEVAL